MAGKSERQIAQAAVAQYHEAQLSALVEHVGQGVDRFRRGELDAFEMDQVLFQYSRAAKDLWKFCNLGDTELAASLIADHPPSDWWAKADPTARRSRPKRPARD